ncbi:DNA alkylation repair protein [Salibacteraceae bacterium]|nr:DNA alkylation repair protein [Salibacteraceae bacterium]
MSRNITSVFGSFDASSFKEYINPKLSSLALKDRAKLIAEGLTKYLPSEYPKAIDILVRSMEIPLKEDDNLGRYAEFYFMPFAEFISRNGKLCFKESMEANYELTKVFTAEFSVRYFIENYPTESLMLLDKWTNDNNLHVRRLVSEGTRPRLPWASRLPGFQKDPKPVLKLLEKLKTDQELYVRRSVANNLNDIAKNHPDVVIETLKNWKKDQNSHTNWIVKHASRSLIKSGHKGALMLQGFDPDVQMSIEKFNATKIVRFGEYLEIDFDLISQDETDVSVVVDFVVYFKKGNGKLSPKVFKLTEKKLVPEQRLTIAKRHPIRPMSTRKYYNGIQRLAIQVNGKEIAEQEFELIGV